MEISLSRRWRERNYYLKIRQEPNKKVNRFYLYMINFPFLCKGMHKFFIHKLTSITLLIAVIIASVPIHEIFHKHNYRADNIKTAHFKKSSKPCCKPFEGIYGNMVSFIKINVVKQPVNTIYLVNYFSYFVKPLFKLSNKAPPVNLA